MLNFPNLNLLHIRNDRQVVHVDIQIMFTTCIFWRNDRHVLQITISGDDCDIFYCIFVISFISFKLGVAETCRGAYFILLLLLFGAESFLFQFTIQKFKDQDI